MRKVISALAALSVLLACNPEDNPGGNDNPDSLSLSVTTGDAFEIEQSSAKLSGASVISNAKASNGVAFFNYGTNADGISTNGKKIDAGSIPSNGGDFSVSITGLEPATTYYYAASVTIDGKTTTGATKSFITKDKPKDPTITGEAKEITEWSAKLSGYANPTQEMGNVTMGILLSSDENPTLDNSKELTSEELDGNNMYTVKATGLNSGTTYYYKSFIKYGGVRRSGEVKSFQTKEIDATTSTEAASEITLFNATINGILKVNSTESLSKSVWFLFSDKELDSDHMKNEGKKYEASLKDDGTFSYSVGDLSYNTTYYYLACSKVHDKEFYGDVKSFVSTDIDAVVSVTTNEAADVFVTKATLGGSLSVESSETLNKSVWFLYSASETTLDGLVANGTKVSASLQHGGVFTHTISDLPSNTKYYYVAVAKVQDKEFYGSVKTFTSKDFSATVSTKNASDIKRFSATLSGSLTVDSIEPLSKEVWFLFSSSATTLDGLINTGDVIATTLSDSGAFTYDLTNLSESTTYHYTACAKVYDRIIYGEVKEFNTLGLPEGAVDMGLSVAWASYNIGATKPEEYGDYYSWGEIETKDKYTEENYKWGGTTSLTKYNTKRDYGSVDNKKVLDPEDDVARVKWGNRWRIPTASEIQELYENCKWTDATIGGVAGIMATSKINGNTLFFPYAGEMAGSSARSYGSTGNYWSANINQSSPFRALRLFVYHGATYNDYFRYYGYSVRAVTE
jgi:hypothetical protein